MYFVTSNANKYKEAQLVFSNLKQYELDTEELQDLDEYAVIKHKAAQAQELLSEPFFVEDVSLQTQALNGLPGTFIKFFVKQLDTQKLSELLRGPAEAICTIGYWDTTQLHIVQARVAGTIVSPRGEGWGFNELFQETKTQKTFAEFSVDEKQRYLHRSIALKKLKERIELNK